MKHYNFNPNHEGRVPFPCFIFKGRDLFFYKLIVQIMFEDTTN